MYRETELAAIGEAFQKTDIVLLSGSAGTGKTRLALEYAKRRLNEFTESQLCIHDRALPLYDDLIMCFEKPGQYFVIIDDANQLSEIRHVAEYANKKATGYKVKILVTVRDYALNKVQDKIAGIASYKIIKIALLTNDEIKSVIKEHYGIANSNCLNRIARIAEGNMRIAMLAGKIARDTNRIDSINDVTQLYEDYYGRVLNESGLNEDNDLLVSAGIIAFLNAVHLEHIDPLLQILAESGMSSEKFVKNLYVLHECEIVDIYYDKAVRFSEQCLSNFVLKYVFYDKKIISLSSMIEACFMPYRERTMHAINTLLTVFQNKDIHEYVKNEILCLWKKQKSENLPDFFEYVKAFYPVNQTETLLIIKDYIDHTEAVDIRPEEINTEDGKNYQSINDDVLTILGGYAETDNLDAALDLFFQYYMKRPDMYMQFYHATIVYFCIRKNSIAHGCYTQIKWINKISEYVNNWDNQYVSVLFMDVAEQFLHLSFSPYENGENDRSIVIYQIPLPFTDKVGEYRKTIWEQLLTMPMSEVCVKYGIKILRNYGHSVDDCSKEVIRFDAPYICKLMQKLLQEGTMASYYVAHSVKKVFDIAGYQTDEIDIYLQNSNVKMYEILKGPKWECVKQLEKREQLKKEKIAGFLKQSPDKMNVFNTMLDIYIECYSVNDSECYDLSNGINILLMELGEEKQLFLSAVRRLLLSDVIEGIDTLLIARKLFLLLTPAETYELLHDSCDVNNNNWLYSYFHELPEKYADKKELMMLYEFLQDNSDRLINRSPCRSISFLDKFLQIDRDVILKGSRIILNKKTYSSFMVKIYFSLLFNENCTSPDSLISKYQQDIYLLEEIYSCLEQMGCNYDYDGAFLHSICTVDRRYILLYVDVLMAERLAHNTDVRNKCCVFYQDEEYIEVFDSIVNKALQHASIPSMEVPEIIKSFITLPTEYEHYAEKRDEWIKHYIEINCKESLEIGCLFTALSETSIHWMRQFLEFFCLNNSDYSAFRSLPLIPMSYSCTGSAIPLYSSWIAYLESTLSLFPGIKFIQHKERIEQLIEYLHNQIIQEEVSDIIEG